ncbi:serine hydrolase domain-containing protein [Nonomuraea maritima]|uniref:serine hydrolase domain-containing protein n=1 Tax=Nonomuraea maritima TaxID=683260 RepID=UPI00370FE391
MKPLGTNRDVIPRLLDRAVGEGGVPGIVIEVRDDRGRWFGAAGVADTGTGRARASHERFRIGSVTKTFVATVILQLVAERRLSLDDTVDDWLPGRVHGHRGGKINIRRLLNHTSGIFSYTDDPAMVNQHERHTPELLVDVAMAHPPAFEPGTDWGYSNTNYILAGMIVERVTGEALSDEISRRITRPLRLDGTYLPRGADPTIQGPHPRHYTKLMDPAPDAVIHDATELESSLFWAAGSMISTTGDLHRFFGALLGGGLLPSAQLEEMCTTVATRNWIPDTAYGLGISSVTLPCGATVWGMGGAIFGSWSYAYGSRDGGHLVVVNVNGDWADGPWDDPIGIFTDVLQAEFCSS